MKKTIIILFGLLLSLTHTSQAQNKLLTASSANMLYSVDQSASPEDVIELPIYLKTNEPVTLFQCDISLPLGLSFVKKVSGKYDVSLDGSRLSEDDNHTLSSSLQTDGSLRLLCSSVTNDTFRDNDGLIATIKLQVAKSVETGRYAIQIKNQKLVKPDNAGFNVDGYQVYISVEENNQLRINCDLNGDGAVDVSDLTILINEILKEK